MKKPKLSFLDFLTNCFKSFIRDSKKGKCNIFKPKKHLLFIMYIPLSNLFDPKKNMNRKIQNRGAFNNFSDAEYKGQQDGEWYFIVNIETGACTYPDITFIPLKKRRKSNASKGKGK